MIGRRIASAWPAPRRWWQAVWGLPDVHTRLQWHAAWPRLASLPREGVRLLDAGCGTGRWTLELAARRPGWQLVGLDRDRGAVTEAERARQALGIANLRFETADFLEYPGDAQPFDVVLSVSSAHYLAAEGRGLELFRRFRTWLRPGGLAILLVPRARTEAGFIPGLARPPWHPVFSEAELRELCAGAELQPVEVSPVIGRLGAAAKQLDWEASERWPGLRVGLYPLGCVLAELDGRRRRGGTAASLMWLLVARRDA